MAPRELWSFVPGCFCILFLLELEFVRLDLSVFTDDIMKCIQESCIAEVKFCLSASLLLALLTPGMKWDRMKSNFKTMRC